MDWIHHHSEGAWYLTLQPQTRVQLCEEVLGGHFKVNMWAESYKGLGGRVHIRENKEKSDSAGRA